MGIYEILRMTPPVREAINEGGSEATIRKAAAAKRNGAVAAGRKREDSARRHHAGRSDPEYPAGGGRIRILSAAAEEACRRKRGSACIAKTTQTLRCLTCGQALESEWLVCPHCSTPPGRAEGRPVRRLRNWTMRQLKLAQKKAGTVQ